MAVPCPSCGRTYDVALFQFGRTIHCTCGTRVGLESRERPASPTSEIRFAADAMLGRLARWLRLIGYDTTFDAAVRDADLARCAYEDDRIVLTRDRALPIEWRLPRVLVLEDEESLDQLRRVVEHFDLDWCSRRFTRCAMCNAELRPATPADVEARVPERVAREQERFLRCAACDRVYWEGSHVARILQTLERALGG